MSAAEIADNKWEMESTKPPVTSLAGIAQIVLMSGFALFFTLVVVGSLVGLVSPKSEGLAGEYSKMRAGGGAADATVEAVAEE
jgi:hypothetical protein